MYKKSRNKGRQKSIRKKKKIVTQHANTSKENGVRKPNNTGRKKYRKRKYIERQSEERQKYKGKEWKQ